MGLTTIDTTLWVVSFFGQLMLLGVLFGRRRAKQFPWFTSLVLYELLQNLALVLVYRHGNHTTYFWTYWSLGLIDACFVLGLVYEIASDGLRPQGRWVREVRTPILVWGASLAVLAALLCFALDPKGQPGLNTWPFRAEQFASLLICELICVIFWHANRLALRWRSWVLGLCRGLAVWNLPSLTIGAVEAYGSPGTRLQLFNRLDILFYLAALGIWTISFWAEEPKREPIPDDVLQQILLWRRGLGYSQESTIDSDGKGP